MARPIKGPLTRPQALFILIISLIMGTVFLTDVFFWNTPIDPSKAIHTELTYDFFRESRNKNNHTQSFTLHFSDHEMLSIDTATVTKALRSQLNALPSGTKLTLLIHPNSDTILSIRSDSAEILSFSDVQNILRRERKGFFILGVLCFCASLYCILWLLVHPKPKYHTSPSTNQTPSLLLELIRRFLRTVFHPNK